MPRTRHSVAVGATVAIVTAFAAITASGSGCGTHYIEKRVLPGDVPYTLDFPSLAAAVDAQNIIVYAYPTTTDAGTPLFACSNGGADAGAVDGGDAGGGVTYVLDDLVALAQAHMQAQPAPGYEKNRVEFPVCDLADGGAHSTADLGLTFGTYTVLAVGLKTGAAAADGGTELVLAGCSMMTISPDGGAAASTISLSPVDPSYAPSTACPSLAQHCAGGC